MSDDPDKHAQDRQRINIDQDHEVRYWMEALGVTKEAPGAAREGSRRPRRRRAAGAREAARLTLRAARLDRAHAQ